MNSDSGTVRRDETSRNPAEYAVLSILALGPAHGYDVFRRLRQGLEKIWLLRRSQVYALLNSLEKEGLVRHERIDQDALPPKKVFSLSADGRNVLFSWLNSPVGNVRDLRCEFLGKLYFVDLICPENKPALVSEQLAVSRERLNSLERMRRRSGKPQEIQALDLKLSITGAAIDWLERFLDQPDA
jgi:DNA-binding PadR family transcriptional regulator